MMDRVARSETGGDQDVRTLLGLGTRASWFLMGSLSVGIGAIGYRTHSSSTGWAIALSLALLISGGVVLLRVSGDPLPVSWTVYLVLLAPTSVVIAIVGTSQGSYDNADLLYNGALTAIGTFMCVRGRTPAAWIALAARLVATYIGGVIAGYDALRATTTTALDVAPLLMATFFALTIRPAVKSVFALREQAASRAGLAAAADAEIDERNSQLDRLEILAGSTLERIATGNCMSSLELLDISLLEAHLRDSLRARALDVAPIVDAARRARACGVHVTLLDDGGMDGLPTVIKDRAHAVIAEAVATASEGTVTARVLPPGRSLLATVLLSSSRVDRRIEIGSTGTVVRDLVD